MVKKTFPAPTPPVAFLLWYLPLVALSTCFYLIPHGCEGFNDTLEPSPAGMPLDSRDDVIEDPR